MLRVGLSLLMVLSLIFTNLSSIKAADEQLSYKQKKELLTKVALEENIPPEILKAIAYSETGMDQFDKNGNPIVSGDGGIGIMQVTMSDEELQDQGIDKQKLMYDTEYNIRQGAKILNQKWNYRFIPTINDHDRNKIQHWYFAVWAYNGLSARNDPNKAEKMPYQEKVFKYLRDNTGITIPPTPKIETSYKSDGTLDFSTKMHYDIEGWNTPSMQSKKAGDIVYTSSSSLAYGVSNLRSYHDTTTESTILAKIEPYSRVKILSGPYESTKQANFFSFFKVSVNGKEGYLATSNLQNETPSAVVPHETFPTQHGQAVGRVIIRDNVPLLKDNKDGTFSITKTNKGNPTLVDGEMVRLYGVKGDYYNVGGDYYIKRFDPNMVVMIGRAYTRKTIKLYVLKNGSLTEHGKIYEPGHYLRVYDYDERYVYVGGDEQSGYHVLKNDRSILLYKGFVNVQKPANLYAPDGSVHSVMQPGERARVYHINDNRFEVGGGYYISINNQVTYSPH